VRETSSSAASLSTFSHDPGSSRRSISNSLSEADGTRTSVRVLGASFGDLEFGAACEVAACPFGRQGIYLAGSYQVRGARDLVNAGDYVGLVAACSTLAAAIVVPEGDVWPTTLRAFGLDRFRDVEGTGIDSCQRLSSRRR
jgi:hypothetical protein